MRVNVGSYGADFWEMEAAAVSSGPPTAVVTQSSDSGSGFWDAVGSALRPVITAAGQAAATSIYSPRPGQPGYVPPPKPPVTGSISLGGVSPNLLVLGGVGLLAVLFLFKRR